MAPPAIGCAGIASSTAGALEGGAGGAADHTSPADVRHFRALTTLNVPMGAGGVVCLTEQSLPLSESTLSIPVAAL